MNDESEIHWCGERKGKEHLGFHELQVMNKHLVKSEKDVQFVMVCHKTKKFIEVKNV